MKKLLAAIVIATFSCLLANQSHASSSPSSAQQDSEDVASVLEAAAEEAVKAAVSALPPRTDQRPDSVIFCEDMATAAKTIYSIKSKGQPLSKAIEYLDFVWALTDAKRYVVASGLALVILRDSSIQDQTHAIALASKACRNES